MDQQNEEKTHQQMQQEISGLIGNIQEEIRKFHEMVPELQELLKEINESPDVELTKEQEEEFNKKFFEAVRGFDDNPVE